MFCLTDIRVVDLPLDFGRITKEEGSWTALASDDWRDALFAARGAEIWRFNAFGQGESVRFAPDVVFAAPIRGLALSSFPHDVLCVLDADQLLVVDTGGSSAAVAADLRGKTVTCVCVDPVSGRVFVGSKGAILLLPSARELFESRGVVRWTWVIGLGTAHAIQSMAFSPMTRWLHVITADGTFHNVLVSHYVILNGSETRNEGENAGVLLCEVSDVATASKGGLCLEVRSAHFFACEANAVAEEDGGRVIARFSSPSLVEHGLRAIAINERRRILYVASARSIEAFEVTSHTWRLTESFVSDCAALAPMLSADTDIAQRTVGVGFALLARLKQEARAGVGAMLFNLDLVGWSHCSLQRALAFRDQAALGPFYAYQMGKNGVRDRVCATALETTPWFDDYARIDSDSGLHARYMLRAFDRGALWALTSGARLAIEGGSTKVHAEAMRVLRTAHARGDMIASEVLAQQLLVSPDAKLHSEGFSVLLKVAQVCRPAHGLWSRISFGWVGERECADGRWRGALCWSYSEARLGGSLSLVRAREHQ